MAATSDHATLCTGADTLAALADRGGASLCPPDVARIAIGTAACGQAAGAAAFARQLRAHTGLANIAAIVDVGCIGACFAEPLVDVRRPDGLHYLFGRADESYWHVLRTAMRATPSGYPWAVACERTPGVLRGIDDLEIVESRHSGLAQFLTSQTRRVSARCGLIDPASVAEYVAAGGYQALLRAVTTLTPADVTRAVFDAGLRGRGGAGYPTGRKWQIAAASPDPTRFVIANADEGDPGAYMNRALLESDPHGILEGLMLASYAVGARQAYIFVRHEYPWAVQVLRRAIASAYESGLLGAGILGSGFDLEVEVIESGGAFVCGEESAMLEVMSARRGEPHRRPPYPTERGLGEHPTVINNVETLANVPWILENGAEAFRGCGTEESPGTKVFCLTGDVLQTGFAEVPLGTRAEALLTGIGGSRPASVRALQIGGPSGGIVPRDDVVLAYESIAESGAMMGSGGLVALSPERCVVDLAQHLVSFSEGESCGKCVVCRDGLARLHEMLLAVTLGKGYEGILEDIEDLAKTIQALSQCGLGQNAVNPVLTTLRHFRDEYEQHVAGRCPTLVCKGLITFEIDEKCCPPRCQYCYLVCPVNAIKLDATGHYYVEQPLCTNCWACHEVCSHNGVRPVSKGGMLHE